MGISLKTYLELKHSVINAGYASEFDWSENIERPRNETEFWLDYGWVVCNSGMKNQIARIIWDKILDAYSNGKKAIDVFGHKGKASAIDDVFEKKDSLYANLLNCKTDDSVLEFCEKLPWIGQITKYHLAKNYGAQVAKPDRWLARLAKLSNESVQDLCKRLSEESGDKIVSVDTVLWRACNLGLCNSILNSFEKAESGGKSFNYGQISTDHATSDETALHIARVSNSAIITCKNCGSFIFDA